MIVSSMIHCWKDKKINRAKEAVYVFAFGLEE